MKSRRIHALQALLAAYETREVYGAQHVGSVASLGRCADSLLTITPDKASVTLAIVTDGVLIDGLAVNDRWATDAPLIVSLRSRGVQVIRMTRGVDAADLDWLFECAKGAVAMMSPSKRIVLGRVQAAGSQPFNDGADDNAVAGSLVGACSHADMVDPLRESWSGLLARTGGGLDARIASLSSKILAASVQHRSSILPLVQLKEHDEYTFVHVTNVAILASALGEAVGLSGDALRNLTEAALLHDVGKWTVPKRILSKPAQLDQAETARMRQHPVIGAAILAAARGVSDISVIVAFEHHMRIDGTGYPEFGASRRPLVHSQIVHLVDVFDALRSNRPYRAGMPTEQCLQILDEQAGRAFDRQLFTVFCDRVLNRLRMSMAA